MNTRRWAGLLLVVFGLSLCGAAGWHYLRGCLAQRQARAEFEGALAENPGDAIALQYLEALKYQVN